MIMIIIICVLAILLGISVYYNLRFGIMIIKIQDAMEESLDVIDERYASISKILEVPLYSDSHEIRKIHDDISATRESMLYIANIMTGADVDVEQNKDEIE